MEFKAGDKVAASRRITEEDVRRFTEISGDAGRHHVHKDEHGRLMAHGLLVASLASKIGGDVDYMAREMRFEFLKAAYAGDTLTCRGEVASAARRALSWRVDFRFEVVNQDGVTVMRGSTSGVILLQKP